MASNVQTLKTQRGGDHLVLENFTYELRRKNKDSIMWCCTQWRVTRCNAQVKTNNNREVLIQKGEHDHPPLSDSHLIFKAALPDLHEKAVQNRRESARSLCLREADKLVNLNEMNLESQEIAKSSKLIYNHVKSLEYHRRKESCILIMPTFTSTSRFTNLLVLFHLNALI